jgi:hypothetical protein
MIAALYVDPAGCYANLEGVELWDEARDARTYAGPWPVVAHPPCQRWGKYWHGGPAAPHTRRLGDDGGCFAAALAAVRQWGGVLEHPAYSRAWFAHGLPWPPAAGWQRDISGGWCCQVEQGAYGHKARKGTWLYAVGIDPPELSWGSAPGDFLPFDGWYHRQKDHARARRTGQLQRLSHKGRAATPEPFRDLLLTMARSVSMHETTTAYAANSFALAVPIE